MMLRYFASSLLAVLFLAAPAGAVTLVLDDSDVFAIGSGDVFDNVVQFDTSSVTMTGGTVTGHYLMLDLATATLAGGTIGNLDVFGEAKATVVIQAGSLVVDGLPTPEPVTLLDSSCASCTIAATLADGTPVGPVPASVLQTGQVEIVAVPEPGTFALFGAGLFGLAITGRRIR